MMQIKDEFMSEEDLDIAQMSRDELYAYWDMWLEQAQSSNDIDKNTYSHGVFTLMEMESETKIKKTTTKIQETRYKQ